MKTKPRLRVLEGALLAFGLLGVGIAVWSVARQEIYESWNNWTFDRRSRGQAATVGSFLTDRLSDRDGSSESRKTAAEAHAPLKRRYDEGDLLGRLTIPRLGIRAIVREGTGAGTLSVALGHIAGTANPGENGNVGVAGHRDSLFRGLRNIEESDEIIFESAHGDRYTYRVESMQVVKPADVGVLRAGLYRELTLVTCYPFYYIGSAPYRYIVKARQVGETLAPLSPDVAQAKPRLHIPSPQPARRVIPSDGAAHGKVSFEVMVNHSKQLARGISIGLTALDPQRKTVDGWVWLLAERRTVWLRDQQADSPVSIGEADGVTRSIVIDLVTRNSLHGYLVSSRASAVKVQ